jgi:hypothetical protein
MFKADWRVISFEDEDGMRIWLTFEQKREAEEGDPHWICIGRRGVIRVSAR